MIIEGAIAVKAALEGGKRPVTRIFMDEKKKSRDLAYIIRLAERQGVPVERCSAEEIEKRAAGRSHGGVIGEAGSRVLQTLEELTEKEKVFLVLVEGVEDSYNMGYIMRTLCAFGCQGLILPPREWNFDDATMIKSSAGASEKLAVCCSSNLDNDLAILKEKGFMIVSAYRGDGSISLNDADLCRDRLLVCIGGPMRGLSSEVLKHTDMSVYIPYGSDFRNALNAASAVSVLSWEVYRQNHKGD
ncbi:MAG: RNA methyltransferase [Erysipelotrichaceae bacterium]|nr:RNA methyltransferase [Erysipelotrichaceae bacterium]